MKQRKVFLIVLLFLLFFISSCMIHKSNQELEKPLEPTSYTIDFINNGYGEKPDSIENQTVIPQLPVLTFEGYSFLGWYLDEKLENKAIEGTKLTLDIILYAKWEKQKIPTPPVIDERYSITFINNGYGEKLDSIENQTVIPQLPVLTFEGYSFQGWYLDEKLENKAIKGTKLTSDIILYAKWEKILLEKLDVFYEIENTDSFGEIQIEVTCGQNVTTYYMYSLTKIDIEK
ncbi:MAG: InlB B-repeat-containing protein, partial [Roseburia sp.]|nr:InlB B-repeat-containing protein [Roseburia sp.]